MTFNTVKEYKIPQLKNNEKKAISYYNDNGYHKIRNILDDYSVSLHLYSPRGYIPNTFD